MTVEEMLRRISSRELSEWQAYEASNGPLGHQYADDMLAHIHEAIQANTYVNGFQYSENPVQEPSHMLRPREVLKAAKEAQENEFDGGMDELAAHISEG